MNFTRNYFQTVKSLLPDILLWLRFPALLSWCALSSGIVLSGFFVIYLINYSETYNSLYIILKSAATISLTLALFLKNNITRQILFVISGALLYPLYMIKSDNLYKVVERRWSNPVTIHGAALSPSLPNPDNIRFLFRIDSTTPPIREFNNKVVQCISSVRVPQGASLDILGTIRLPGRQRNAYEFDEYRYLQSNGIMASFKIDTILTTTTRTSLFTSLSSGFRASVSSIINKFTNQDHRAILYAVFLGEPQYLSSYLKDVFRNSGTYHILSISGLHAAMLLAMCYFFLNAIPIPPVMRHGIALGVLWSYQLFIGFIPCLFRATIMSTIFILAYVLQKKNYTIQALGIAGTAWLCISPDSLFQAGYQLSFAATLGILLLCPVFDACKPSVKNRHLDFLVAKLALSFNVSLAGTLSTLPVLLYHFGTFSVLGLLSNIVAVPAMSCSMWLFFTSIISSLIVPWAVPFCIGASAWFLDILVKCAEISTILPFSSISLSSLSTLLTVLFAAGTILIAGAVKKIRLQLTVLFLMLLSCCAGIEWIVAHKSNCLVMSRFDLDDAEMTALRDEHGIITLYVANHSKSDFRWQRIFTSWERHQRFASLKKIIYTNTTRKRFPDRSQLMTPFRASTISFTFVDMNDLSDSIKTRLHQYKQVSVHNVHLPITSSDALKLPAFSGTSAFRETSPNKRQVFVETSFRRIR
ncbi:MAG: ComEC family competence protein [Fibrobacter sp.]|nr:ComEC family competence protein [Fibrobacter sp.]